MYRTFCEAMDEDPALVLTMLEDLGHIDSPRARRLARARIRDDIEMYGCFNVSDVLMSCDIDQLTDEELEYLRGLF